MLHLANQLQLSTQKRRLNSPNPSKQLDLLCEVRERLIDFLRREHPEGLPKVRDVNIDTDESSEIQRRRRWDDTDTTGTEHERGSKSPGVHAEEKGDGANA